ncbi:MAG TPA: hypothetical protein VGE01_00470 [Fimbriimonas sp.]
MDKQTELAAATGGYLSVSATMSWPSGRGRTPFWRRSLGSGAPPIAYALEQVTRELRLLRVGHAELSVDDGEEPAAVLRLRWRGRSLAVSSDADRTLAGNVLAMRSPLMCLHALALDRQLALLGRLLNALADGGGPPLPPVGVGPEELADKVDDALCEIGDVLAVVGWGEARRERGGIVPLLASDRRAAWSRSRNAVSVRVDSYPILPQALAMGAASLEVEPWVRSVGTGETLGSSRWRICLEPGALQRPDARAWVAGHTMLRERAPEVRRWVEEGGR